MTIIEASEVFKALIKETDNKREAKVYNNFFITLSGLNTRNFSKEQLILIEDELEALNLKSNPKNKRKYYSKKYNAFQDFLKTEFSLVSEGYYTAIGMSLGMCFGVAIGTSFGASGTSMGLALGMLIGIAIGRTLDMEAEKQNRVLKNKVAGL